MNRLLSRPAEPEGRDDEEGSCDAGEREAVHLFVLSPWFVRALGACEDRVPGQVHDSRDGGADGDGEKGETYFAGVELLW